MYYVSETTECYELTIPSLELSAGHTNMWQKRAWQHRREHAWRALRRLLTVHEARPSLGTSQSIPDHAAMSNVLLHAHRCSCQHSQYTAQAATNTFPPFFQMQPNATQQDMCQTQQQCCQAILGAHTATENAATQAMRCVAGPCHRADSWRTNTCKNTTKANWSDHNQSVALSACQCLYKHDSSNATPHKVCGSNYVGYMHCSHACRARQ
jgi:hypothetical protein